MQLGKTQAAALLLIVGSAAAFAEPGRKEDGHKAYVAACAKCHDHGSQGAPVTNNPKDWADQMELEYDVSVVFFDEAGKEVFRLDSESGRDRVRGAMQYSLDKGYLRHENMQRWSREKRMRQAATGSG